MPKYKKGPNGETWDTDRDDQFGLARQYYFFLSFQKYLWYKCRFHSIPCSECGKHFTTPSDFIIEVPRDFYSRNGVLALQMVAEPLAHVRFVHRNCHNGIRVTFCEVPPLEVWKYWHLDGVFGSVPFQKELEHIEDDDLIKKRDLIRAGDLRDTLRNGTIKEFRQSVVFRRLIRNLQYALCVKYDGSICQLCGERIEKPGDYAMGHLSTYLNHQDTFFDYFDEHKLCNGHRHCVYGNNQSPKDDTDAFDGLVITQEHMDYAGMVQEEYEKYNIKKKVSDEPTPLEELMEEKKPEIRIPEIHEIAQMQFAAYREEIGDDEAFAEWSVQVHGTMQKSLMSLLEERRVLKKDRDMKAYFLSTDGDAHWYMVEADKRQEWNTWRNLDDDDPAAWDVPEFAKELGGSPSNIEFYPKSD